MASPSPPRLLLATHNASKADELRRILVRLLAGTGIAIVGREALPTGDPPDEIGETFEANARAKALWYAQAAGLPAVADDSGLVVDALDGRPGVRSARYGPDAAARNARLLEELRGIEPARRTARFECVAALALPDGRWWCAAGQVEGRIAGAPRGGGGFGYDPIFELVEPPFTGRTAAELTPEEKDAVSHRARALAALAPVILERLGQT